MRSYRPSFRRGYRAALTCATALALALFLTACGSALHPATTTSAASLTLTPSSASVPAGTTLQLHAAGTVQPQHWSVNGVVGGNAQIGIISDSGVYTAPSVPPGPDNLTITVDGADLVAQATIAVVNPAPAAVSVSPAAVMQGSDSTSVSISGSGFNPVTQVSVNGVTVPAAIVSGTSIVAQLPSDMTASQGSVSLTVANPAPGGGTAQPVSLTVVPNGTVSASTHPLVALYDVNVPANASVSVQFSTDTNYGFTTSAVNTPAGGGPVEIQVAGMRASTLYHMRAQIAFADGTTLFDTDHTFTTGAIPANRLPNLTVKRTAGAVPSPGVELLDLIFPNGQQLQAVATDLDGNVIWYYDLPSTLTPIPVKLLPNGHMLLNINNGDHTQDALREIDLVGSTIRELKIADLNSLLAQRGFNIKINQMHHEITPLPNGHIIVLGQDTRMISGLTGYTGATKVQGDDLIDLDENLVPVWTWSSFDHLDPNRHLQGLPDWTHSNAVVYSPADHNLLLSMRHQSWVLKLDYQDGAGHGGVIWRFGDQGDFTLTSGDRTSWQYAQHYPRIVSSDGNHLRLEVMDNGNLRMNDSGIACGTAGGPACYSRVAVFDIDETLRTATPAWDFRPGFYSGWGGSAEALANGNFEGSFCSQPVAPALVGSRIIETTPTATPQVVWELDVAAQSAYRGFRIPSLYPGVQW